jgi:hypothetical protein
MICSRRFGAHSIMLTLPCVSQAASTKAARGITTRPKSQVCCWPVITQANTPSAGTENSRSCIARDSPAGATATASALHLATVPSFVYTSADSA